MIAIESFALYKTKATTSIFFFTHFILFIHCTAILPVRSYSFHMIVDSYECSKVEFKKKKKKTHKTKMSILYVHVHSQHAYVYIYSRVHQHQV